MNFTIFESIDGYIDALNESLQFCREKDGHIVGGQLKECYDMSLKGLVIELSKVYEIAESSDDCDLSFYSYVPPSREIVLVVNNLTLDGGVLVRNISEIIGRLPLWVVISLDGVGYVSITRDGRVLGFSKFSDLSEYGF